MAGREPPPEVRCGTCRHAQGLVGRDGRPTARVVCRRHAPAPAMEAQLRPKQPGEEDMGTMAPLWPLPLVTEWCGEWEPRPAGKGVRGG